MALTAIWLHHLSLPTLESPDTVSLPLFNEVKLILSFILSLKPTRLTPLSPSSAVPFQVLLSPPNVALDLSGGNTFSSVLGSTPDHLSWIFRTSSTPSIPSPVRNTLKSRGNSDVNPNSTSTTTSIKPFTTSHHQHSYRPSKTESRKT